MEASKCPKCGDEPLFIEHLSKWYCYGCNTYVDEEKHECGAEPLHEGNALPIEEGVKALENEETARECKTCGAKLQDLKDGSAYCFMCETYQDEPAAEMSHVEEPKPAAEPAMNESQKLLEEAKKTEKFVGEPAQVVHEEASAPVIQPMETKIEVAMPVIINVEEAAPKAQPEPEPEAPAPKAPEIKVRVCTGCGQPLKYIDKYSRYYCYACKKYASREDPARAAVPAPATKPVKACPDCGKPLKFVEKYTEWYCYECKKYPLRERARAAVAKTPDTLSCPTCGEPLKFIPQYSRHYCYKCKKYAPKGTPQRPSSSASEHKAEGKVCPACKEQMKYVSEYNEWYCYKCRKYSLRPIKPILL